MPLPGSKAELLLGFFLVFHTATWKHFSPLLNTVLLNQKVIVLGVSNGEYKMVTPPVNLSRM